MAKQLMALAAKCEDPSSIPRTHVKVKRGHKHMLAFQLPPPHTHMNLWGRGRKDRE